MKKIWIAVVLLTAPLNAHAIRLAAAVKLVLTPNTLSFFESGCSPSTVLTTNTFGQPTPVTGDKTLDISQTLDINRGPASLSFYSDSGCTQKGSRFTIRSQTSSCTFYMSGSAAGTFSIRAQVQGLQAGTQNVIVASKLGPGDGYQNPPTTAPPQASTVGYSRLAFDDEFNSVATISPDGSGSYKWYTTNFFDPSAMLPTSGYKVNNGYLTILTDASGYSYGIATATPTQTSGVWQHGYFEARIRFNPTGYQGSAWPAFWSYSLEGALSSVPDGGYFSELDFMECYPWGSSCAYITTVHQWQHTTFANTSLAQNLNNVPTVPAGTDFAQWHVYSCLVDAKPDPMVPGRQARDDRCLGAWNPLHGT
jgi:hypothetical protein